MYSDLTFNPNQQLRITFQFADKAYYGTRDTSGKWAFEQIDSTDGSGIGIQLAVGGDYKPQVLYYSSTNKNLLHVLKSEGAWSTSVLQHSQQVKIPNFAFALNRQNQARVS